MGTVLCPSFRKAVITGTNGTGVLPACFLLCEYGMRLRNIGLVTAKDMHVHADSGSRSFRVDNSELRREYRGTKIYQQSRRRDIAIVRICVTVLIISQSKSHKKKECLDVQERNIF